MREYERPWDRRLRPKFGDLSLDAIKPRDVAQWRAELLDGGAGPEAVRYAMVLLQAMFTVAIEWGEATANPVSVVRKPRQGRGRAVQPIAPEGVEALRAAFLATGDTRSATLVCVLAYAGLRPGEALALEVRHIRERTLLVEQAVSDGHMKLQKTGRRYRTVDLLAPLAEDLARWREEQRYGAPDDLLFPRSDGAPWRTDDWRNWRTRQFRSATKRTGLGEPRPYDLRHSFASMLVRAQHPSVVDIADQLGHAPGMTLSTYAHVFAEYRGIAPVDPSDWIRTARNESVSTTAFRPER